MKKQGYKVEPVVGLSAPPQTANEESFEFRPAARASASADRVVAKIEPKHGEKTTGAAKADAHAASSNMEVGQKKHVPFGVRMAQRGRRTRTPGKEMKPLSRAERTKQLGIAAREKSLVRGKSAERDRAYSRPWLMSVGSSQPSTQVSTHHASVRSNLEEVIPRSNTASSIPGARKKSFTAVKSKSASDFYGQQEAKMAGNKLHPILKSKVLDTKLLSEKLATLQSDAARRRSPLVSQEPPMSRNATMTSLASTSRLTTKPNPTRVATRPTRQKIDAQSKTGEAIRNRSASRTRRPRSKTPVTAVSRKQFVQAEPKTPSRTKKKQVTRIPIPVARTERRKAELLKQVSAKKPARTSGVQFTLHLTHNDVLVVNSPLNLCVKEQGDFLYICDQAIEPVTLCVGQTAEQLQKSPAEYAKHFKHMCVNVFATNSSKTTQEFPKIFQSHMSHRQTPTVTILGSRNLFFKNIQVLQSQ